MARNSLMGTVSLIISVAVVVISAFSALLAGTGIIGREMAEAAKNEVVRFWFVGSFIIAVVALALGIGGLFTKSKRKKSAFWGAALSGIIVVGIITFLQIYYNRHHDYYTIHRIFFAKPAPNADPITGFMNDDKPDKNKLTTEFIDKLTIAHKRNLVCNSADSLRHDINRIYAFYGFPFKKADVRSLFYYPQSPYREDPIFRKVKYPRGIDRIFSIYCTLNPGKRALMKNEMRGC